MAMQRVVEMIRVFFLWKNIAARTHYENHENLTSILHKIVLNTEQSIIRNISDLKTGLH